MRILFLRDTFIRTTPNNHAISPIGVIYKGTTLEVETTTYNGVMVNGVDTYYKDKHGWYYWGGRVQKLDSATDGVSQKPSVDIAGEEKSKKIGIILPELEEYKNTVKSKSFVFEEHHQNGNGNGQSDAKALISNEDHIETDFDEVVDEVIAPTDVLPLKTDQLKPNKDNDTLMDLDPEFEALFEMSKEEAVTNIFADLYKVSDEPIILESERLTYDVSQISPQINNASIPQIESTWWLRDLKVPTLMWSQQQLSGKKIKIAVLDSGIHPEEMDLKGRVSTFFDFTNGATELMDADGHGTLSALLMAGSGRFHTKGIAPDAELVVAKVFDKIRDTIDFTVLMQAIKWAIQQRSDIILFNVNMRSGQMNPAQRDKFKAIIDMAFRKNIIFITPVGDSAITQRPERFYPAAYKNCLAIGAYQRNKERHPRSVRSYSLDVSAPGPVMPGQDKISGFAASVTAGLFALFLQFIRDNHINISTEQFLTLVKTSALRENGHTIEYGYGLLDPVKMFEGLKGYVGQL